MQWLILAFWSLIMVIGIKTGHPGAIRVLFALGLITAMTGQLVLLWCDDLLSWETALPLHLCGLFGVLSIPFLFWQCQPLWEASALLAAPAAACTLFFPAVIACSHPLWMAAAFSQLHVLIALTPVVLFCTGKPLPSDARRTFILGSGYLIFIWFFNQAFGTNYLFLRMAPAGTPLQLFHSRGTAFYICSLLMVCMVVFSCLQGVYSRINHRFSPLTAGNS